MKSRSESSASYEEMTINAWYHVQEAANRVVFSAFEWPSMIRNEWRRRLCTIV